MLFKVFTLKYYLNEDRAVNWAEWETEFLFFKKVQPFQGFNGTFSSFQLSLVQSRLTSDKVQTDVQIQDTGVSHHLFEVGVTFPWRCLQYLDLNRLFHLSRLYSFKVTYTEHLKYLSPNLEMNKHWISPTWLLPLMSPQGGQGPLRSAGNHLNDLWAKAWSGPADRDSTPRSLSLKSVRERTRD